MVAYGIIAMAMVLSSCEGSKVPSPASQSTIEEIRFDNQYTYDPLYLVAEGQLEISEDSVHLKLNEITVLSNQGIRSKVQTRWQIASVSIELEPGPVKLGMGNKKKKKTVRDSHSVYRLISDANPNTKIPSFSFSIPSKNVEDGFYRANLLLRDKRDRFAARAIGPCLEFISQIPKRSPYCPF